MKSLKEIIKNAAPNVTQTNLDKYCPHLTGLMPKYGMDTPLRQRHFLAQLLHESGWFQYVRENLNYSAEGLLKIFPKYFSSISLARQYERQPEKIANQVYGNRLGNGNVASGDGWRFIGRGLIQITGRFNYENVSQALFVDLRLLDKPSLLEEPQYAVESACYFWKSNNLNALADEDDIVAVTKRINGGVNGLDDRKRYYDKLIMDN